VAFDQHLADRVLEQCASLDNTGELRMFGGWGVTINGNLAVGVIGDGLMVRVGTEAYEHALTLKGARPFDFTGRVMKGWIAVDGEAVESTRALKAWVNRGVDFAVTLPAKSTTKRPPRR
jgi:TfoX/Sxy family transcriptional regulator of competence genes